MAQKQLTDARIKSLPPGSKPYRSSDRDGLYVFVTPAGAKSFRYNYSIHGRQKTICYGRYPTLGLADARRMHIEARQLIAKDVDPMQARKASGATAKVDTNATFSAIARRWHEGRRLSGLEHATLKKDAFFLRLTDKAFGTEPIEQITNSMVIDLIRSMQKESLTNWPRRVREKLSAVFRFAFAEGHKCTKVADTIRDAVATPVTTRNHPFIEDLGRMGQLLRDSENYSGNTRVRVALSLLPHVFVRPGELRFARWDEFNLVDRVWTIPGRRMKMKRDHLVPLTVSTIGFLEQLLPLKSESPFVFQGAISKIQPISDGTLNSAMRSMGYGKDEIVAHGFRGFASTTLNELGFDGHHIEKRMAHETKHTVRGVYNKAEYWPSRVEMMRQWSLFLEELKSKTKTR